MRTCPSWKRRSINISGQRKEAVKAKRFPDRLIPTNAGSLSLSEVFPLSRGPQPHFQYNTTMELQDNPTAAATGEDRQIKIHPLAIIGISDHHTRVIMGGSALPSTSPVVGLLFGYIDGGVVSIVDAEDMEWPGSSVGGGGDVNMGGGEEGGDHRAAISKKIELHRKVFPRHEVVGWYRVQKETDSMSNNNSNLAMDDSFSDLVPSEDDLRMNQTEMSRYCGEGVDRPLFVLMNAASPEYTGKKDDKQTAAAKGGTSSDLLGDAQLPLTVYETLVTEGGGIASAVFVNVDFELETYEPERIAVEKVFKTAPGRSAAAAAAANASQPVATSSTKEGVKEEAKKTRAGKKKKDDGNNQPKISIPNRGPSELDVQLDSLRTSIGSMNARMGVLLEFLRKVEKGELPPDNTLLRSVDGLVQQLPLVMAALEEGTNPYSADGGEGRKPLSELENEYNDTMLLSYLAAVAKTAKTVHLYAKKHRVAFEGNNSTRDVGGRRAVY